MSRAVQIQRSEMRIGRNGNGIGTITLAPKAPAASGGLTIHRKEATSIPEPPPLAAGANHSTIITANGKQLVLAIHPLAEIIPGLPADEFARLVDHFRKIIGNVEPILTSGAFGNGDSQKILERDRYLACKAAGVTLRFRPWDGNGSLAETVARLNLPRLHLTDSQRAAVAVPIAEQISAEQTATRLSGLRQGNSCFASKDAIPAIPSVVLKIARRASDRESAVGEGADCYDRARQIAANICHVSSAYVGLAAQIKRDLPEVFEHVRLGEVNLSVARILLQKNKSLRGLGPGAPGVENDRRKATDDLILTGDCIREMQKLPRRKYQIIFADPPYNNGFHYDADPTGDKLSDSDYLRWTERWMWEAAQLLAPNGSMFVLIDDRYDDFFGTKLRAIRDPSLHRRGKIFWWEEFASHQTTKFTNAMRFIHYFTRSEKDFVWNGDAILVPSKRQTVYGDHKRANPEGKVPANVWPVPRLAANSRSRSLIGMIHSHRTGAPPTVNPSRRGASGPISRAGSSSSSTPSLPPPSGKVLGS